MNTNRYFLYARKSQERDDRQVASIKDQISDMQSLAAHLGLEIVEVFQEARSAKKKGRPIFGQMLKRIKKGEANGILCWKLNRLARNAFDAGEVTDLLQESVIAHIQTYEKGFYPHDNVMLMMIEFGIATQYSKDLSFAVKRGYRGKVKDGWYPAATLPVGYLHNPGRIHGEDHIVTDPDRFPILKQLWEMMGSGAYSISEIRKKATILGLKNPKGKPYSQSSFHRIFSHTFYYGVFRWKDENGIFQEVKGKHKPMISKELYLLVQQHLGRRSRDTRPHTFIFPYRGLITCGECGGHVTAERKVRVICEGCRHKFSAKVRKECPRCKLAISAMKHPSRTDITYYRCTKNKKPSCSQKTISEKEIDQKIIAALKTLEIKKSVYHYLKGVLQGQSLSDDSNEQIIKTIKATLSEKQKKQTNLIEMRLNAEISSEEFARIKSELDQDILKSKQELELREAHEKILKQEASRYLDVTYDAVNTFKKADNFVKKSMVEAFASNLTLLDKTLYFSTKKPLLALSNDLHSLMLKKHA